MLILLLDLIDEEDKVKFEIVFNKYENLVRYIALQKLNNQALAEESAQEAWFSIARNFKKVGEPEDVKTKNYIATIANTCALKAYNKEIKESSIEFNDDILVNAANEEFFDRLDMAELSAVITKLSEKQRMFLYLSYSFGYTSKEIGKLYGVSPDSVRKTIQFAKEKIRQELEN